MGAKNGTCPVCRRAVTEATRADHDAPPCSQCEGKGDWPLMCRQRCSKCRGSGHGPALHTRPEDHLRCQFCNGTFAPAREPNGDPVALIHTQPPCDTFMALEVEDFVAATNDILRGGKS
jgi:hypothetical protein